MNDFASVTTLHHGGASDVVEAPEHGSYIECNTTGVRRRLRQESAVWTFDQWVKPMQLGRQGALFLRESRL